MVERRNAWVVVTGMMLTSHYAATAPTGSSAAQLVMPLDAANIPYRWEPFDPQHAVPSVWRGPMPFRVLVPAEYAEEAAAALAAASVPATSAEYATSNTDPARGAALDSQATPDDLAYWEGEDITDEDLIEDSAALAAAQAAVNEARSVSAFSVIGAGEAIPIDASEWSWVYLAEGHAPGPIEFLSAALNEADVETLWEPFPPEKRAAFWGSTNLTVYVPVVKLDQARELVDEIGAWDDVDLEPDGGEAGERADEEDSAAN